MDTFHESNFHDVTIFYQQAISARERALCQLTVCFEFQSRRFQVTTDLLNSENLKIAMAQLCNELHVCNFTVMAEPKLNSENLKVAIAQLCDELKVCNFTVTED